MKTNFLLLILINNFNIIFSQNIISIQDIGCCDKKYSTIVLFDSFHSNKCKSYLDSNYENFGKKKIRRFKIDTFTIKHSENLFNSILKDSIFESNNDSIFQNYGTIRIRVFECNRQLLIKNIDIKDSLILLELIHQKTTDIKLKRIVEDWMEYIKETKQQ